MNARHHRRPALAMLGLAAILTLAACAADAGGPPADEGATDAPQVAVSTPTPAADAEWVVDPDPEHDLTACDIITAADVEQVFGVAAEPTPKVSETKGISDCRYDTVGLVVLVDSAKGDRRFAGARSTYAGATDVPGIGDGAFFSESESAFVVLKSRTSVFLRLRGDDRAEQWRQLAALALMKL